MKEHDTSKFHLEGKPPLKEALPLGLQHFVSMIAGNMVPAMLISNIVGLDKQMSTMLMQGAMLVAGIATLLQLYSIPLFKGYRLGSKLPVIIGTNYVFLGACLSVAGKYGLKALFGAQIGGAIVVFFIAFGIKKIRHLFTPIIAGTMIACMGISLFPTAVKNLAGGEGSATFGEPINFAIGLIVVVAIILLMKFGKGLVQDAAILIGIIFGYLVSLAFGLVDFSAIQGTPIFSFPKPLAFGLEFRLDLILMFAILFMVAIADMMGAATIATMGAMNREVTDKELESATMGNALTSIIASVFSSIPTGVFGQNAAIVAINKVTSRFVLSITGVVLILVGFSPLLGAIITTIPSCIIGGVTLIVFSSIAMAGYDMISKSGFTSDNNLIAGVSITLSIGITSVPQTLEKFPEIIRTLVGNSCIVSVFIVAMIIKYILSIKSNKSNDIKIEA